MTEEHKTFAGGIDEEDEDEEEEEEEEVPVPEPKVPPPILEEVEIEPFADFSQLEDTMVPEVLGEEEALPPPPPPTSTSEEPEEEIPTKKGGGLGEGGLEPKKASLEIEDHETRLLRGESGESPVTPEELELHNLAKLESLKESDA